VAFNRDQLETGRLVWLLDIKIRGQTYRFSTDVIDVSNTDTTAGSSILQYRGGLEFLEYEDTVGLLDAEASSREVSLSVLFASGQEEGWTAITDTARDIGSATGSLSLHLVGDDHKIRQVVIDGFLDSPSYGGISEPVAFTLQESDHLDPLQFPPFLAVVNDITWPLQTVSGDRLYIDDSARGELYPWVFGRPGTHPPVRWWGQDSGLFAASPALLARIDQDNKDNATHACKFVIAGHETWLDPDYSPPGAVLLFSDSWSTPAGETPAIELDGSRNTITTVEMTSTGPSDLHLVEPGQEVWVCWAGRGGVPNKARTGPLIGAGEIIEYLLDQSGLRVDTLRSRAVLGEVDGFALDFWINEPRSPMEIITEDILPALPLSPQVRADGLAFVYWRWDATADDAIEAINLDQGFGDRAGPVEVSPISEVYNSMTIRYCQTGPDGSYRKELTYAPENPDDLHNVVSNPYAWASFTRYGLRQGPVIEVPVIERDDTARAVLDWRIRLHSQTRRSVSYRLPQKYQSLEPGDVVTVTDSEVGFDAAVCIVTGVIRAPGITEISFVTVPHWARDALT